MSELTHTPPGTVDPVGSTQVQPPQPQKQAPKRQVITASEMDEIETRQDFVSGDDLLHDQELQRSAANDQRRYEMMRKQEADKKKRLEEADGEFAQTPADLAAIQSRAGETAAQQPVEQAEAQEEVAQEEDEGIVILSPEEEAKAKEAEDKGAHILQEDGLVQVGEQLLSGAEIQEAVTSYADGKEVIQKAEELRDKSVQDVDRLTQYVDELSGFPVKYLQHSQARFQEMLKMDGLTEGQRQEIHKELQLIDSVASNMNAGIEKLGQEVADIDKGLQISASTATELGRQVFDYARVLTASDPAYGKFFGTGAKSSKTMMKSANLLQTQYKLSKNAVMDMVVSGNPNTYKMMADLLDYSKVKASLKDGSKLAKHKGIPQHKKRPGIRGQTGKVASVVNGIANYGIARSNAVKAARGQWAVKNNLSPEESVDFVNFGRIAKQLMNGYSE